MANNISAVTIDQLPWKPISGTDTIITGSGSLLYRSNVPSLQNHLQEVFEFDTVANFPSTGKSSALYIDESSNILYRWNGSSYVQVSDSKDYLRGDINDNNGSNKLTLGSLEVLGQTTLQNGLRLNSIPTGTSNNILTINGSGNVEQRVFSLGDIDIANAAGVSQFPVGLGDQLRIQGSGDTSISFDGITNTINIASVPGSGTGGAVTSFNGRTGGVVSQAGDYSTAMVNENTNLYFTEARVRGTDLTGLTVTNTPISSTNTFIQALGRLQGQINDRITGSYTGFDSRYVNVTGDTMTGDLVITSPNSSTSLGVNPAIIVTNTSGSTFGTRAEIGFINATSSNLTGVISSRYNSFSSGSYGGELIFGTKQNTDANVVERLKLNSGGAEISGNLNVSGSSIFQGNISAPVGLFGSGSSAPIRLSGTGTGDSNTVYMQFNDNASNRQGYVGFPSSSHSNLQIVNDVSGTFISISGNGGTNGFDYYDGSSSRTVYHSGNLRSDSQNDSRYVQQTRTIIAGDGLTGGGNLSANRTLSVDATVARMNATNTGSLTVTGNMTANGFYESSDIRLKENIAPLEYGLKEIEKIDTHTWNWKSDGSEDMGVIAQELELIMPELVKTNEDGYKSVNYSKLIPVLINAIKELSNGKKS